MNTKDEAKTKLIESLHNGLIVSCQVQKDDPIYTDDMAVKMAEAAKWGGAAGIRANSPEQISAIRSKVDLPVIGLWKVWHEDTDVFITPTMKEVRAIHAAGAQIIAMDCTAQTTHEKTTAWDLLPQVQKEFPEAITFADVSDYAEAKHAVEMGADIVAPTLYGYTKATAGIDGPDWRLFAKICRDFGNDAYIMMEGHIYTPEDAMKVLYLGAYAVIVGSAITRPHLTTKRFTDLMGKYSGENWRTAEKAKH